MSQIQVEKGIITYMYLENFVTYNSVSLKPGRYLNVIIGPNGTGKSTLVCAIVLGLGGKPTTIGRATHIQDYVKSGCQNAKIEIHLKNTETGNIVICRTFDIQGKSTWFLNKKTSNAKEIQEITRELNIQIDNLCQFLPQDKVQDFSKMNMQELLINTERSVGDPKILECHENLIKSGGDYKDIERQINNKKKLLETKIQIHDSLKETVSTIKEKKLIKKKITALKQKRAWVLYDQKRKELLQLKTIRDAAESEKKSIETEIKPIIDAINKIKSEIKVLENAASDHNTKVKLKMTKLQKIMDDIVECENEIKDCENTCKQKIEAEGTRDHEIRVAEEQKSKLDSDFTLMLRDVGSEENLIKKRQEALAEVDEKRNIINMLTSKASAYKQQEEHINVEIKAQESELQHLNIESKRLQLLKERSPDSFRAVQWLRENRDKFSKTIHNPILLNINVKDLSYAKYLESVIANRDLTAFVCEEKQDMNLLLHCLRDEQNLQVNAVYVDPMKHVSMEPIVPVQNIKQFGFTHYLVSLIEAPASIMKYLIAMYRLNTIPIGTNRVEDNIDNVPGAINLYFSQNTVYSVNRSKYTGEKSISMQTVSGNGMLSITLDKQKLSNIEERLKSLRVKKNKLINEVRQIDEEVHERTKELDEDRTKRNKYQQDLQQVLALKSRISIIQNKITGLQNERSSVEQIKASSVKDIKAILKKQFILYKMYNTALEDMFKYTTANEQTELALKLQKRSLVVKMNDSQDLREKLLLAEGKVKQLTVEMQPLKNEVARMYEDAKKSTDGLSPSDPAFAPINKTFTKLPQTLEEINNDLNIAQAKVYCMGNNQDGENILIQYEEVEREIRELKEFIRRKSHELETTSQNITMLQERWLIPLRELVERINTNFSQHFSAMDCAGEVVLAQPENHLDFAQYGLKILVKFRDSDQLQGLTRYHQSGGERAVTTAIYMISLQELSRVPFRCVDEINQGMDAINERRVFNLLVKITGRPNSSQYFLLTPKLLPNLEYSETVTVHCVFNGPYMIGHDNFNIEDYINHLSNRTDVDTDDD